MLEQTQEDLFIVQTNQMLKSIVLQVLLIPVSARIALGMRYYFNNNIGINSELGIGGPMLSVGVSVRL